MGKPAVGVILLNYKGLTDTLECIGSLKNINTSNFSMKIIVVDNDSQDGSAQKLSKLKGIEFIKSSSNTGFSGGNNIGIKEALRENLTYVLILNNDTYTDKSFLKELISAAKYGDIITPKIYFAPGYEFHKERYSKNQKGKVIWYAGGEIDWNNILGRHLGVDEIDRGQHQKRKNIEFATGACMLVKSEVFKKIGFLDEAYFLYLEDMDFSVRAIRAGFKIIYEPKSVLWHKNASASGGSGSSLQNYFISRNRLLFAFKYAPIRTKFSLVKHIFLQAKNPIVRKALIDFLTLNFGKGSFLK